MPRTEARQDDAVNELGDYRWRGYAVGTPTVVDVLDAAIMPDGATPGAKSADGWALPEFTKEQLQGAVTAWRGAILQRNAGHGARPRPRFLRSIPADSGRSCSSWPTPIQTHASERSQRASSAKSRT